MTRKDYRAIADVIATQVDLDPDTLSSRQVLRLVAAGIADVLEEDNPRFDRSGFLKTCGF